jgi:hypothetical protein
MIMTGAFHFIDSRLGLSAAALDSSSYRWWFFPLRPDPYLRGIDDFGFTVTRSGSRTTTQITRFIRNGLNRNGIVANHSEARMTSFGSPKEIAIKKTTRKIQTWIIEVEKNKQVKIRA